MPKEIALNPFKGYVYKAVVDEDDYPWLTKFTWYYQYGYALTQLRGDGNKQVKIRMHRLILGVQDKRKIVDHINCDRLDNRKENLRIASGSLNAHNDSSDIMRVRLSIFRGVSLRTDANRRNIFAARMNHTNKNVHLGDFDDIVDAAIAYDKAVTEVFGSDAVTNDKILTELYLKFKNKLTGKKKTG